MENNIGSTPINMTLTLDEINFVLTSLGNMPYGQVVNLIEKIRDQAVPQIPTPQIAEETKTDA
jgi:hypothetical protein